MAAEEGSNNKWVRVNSRTHDVIATVHGTLQSLPNGLRPDTYGEVLELILNEWLNRRTALAAALEFIRGVKIDKAKKGSTFSLSSVPK